MTTSKVYVQRLRTSASHYTGTAIALLLTAAADREEKRAAEVERMRGLLGAAHDVLAGMLQLSTAEHDALLDLIGLALKDAEKYDAVVMEAAA